MAPGINRNAFDTNSWRGFATVAFNFDQQAKGESVRNVLDCGVLLAPGHEDAMRDWVTGQRGGLARVRLHLVPLSSGVAPELTLAVTSAMPSLRPAAMPCPPAAPCADAASDVQALARLAVALRRFDSCILPVAPSSVAWARMALAQAGATLTTPILLLMTDMKAPAIEDLLGLGASDFIAQPACLESMRVRLGRLRRTAQGQPASWPHSPNSSHSSHSPPLSHSPQPALSPQPSLSSRNRLREPAAHYAALAGERAAPGSHSRPPVPADLLDEALAGLGDAAAPPRRLLAQESFRLAKARVVDGFERDYIRHALSRHGGNVAQAARACSKHRRAFWALMRKHGIEAAPYRRAAQLRNAHALGAH